MIDGHGDDIRQFKAIKVNFSSNVFNHFNHNGLKEFLKERMDVMANYPEPEPCSLEAAVALDLGLDSKEVMVTNGATEAIYLTAQTFKGKRSFIQTPTFAEYADACHMFSHEVHCSHTLGNLTDMNLCWLCNPNNPTGEVLPKEMMRKMLQRYPDTIFVLDASYAPFTLEPLLTPQEGVEWANLVMLHSMTKEYAVPGLRLGYITANHRLLDRIRANHMPWSVNALAQEAGHYLLANKQAYSFNLQQLLSERKRMAEAFEQTGLIHTFKSDSHILLCRLERGTAPMLKTYLAEQHGLLIRDASNFQGLDERFFRIAAQSPEENTLLIKAIQIWIASLHT